MSKEEKPSSVFDVFKTQGPPTITYVRREEGRFENRLANSIDSHGLICLLTGPSKTGKTWLYSTFARERGMKLLQVRCYEDLETTEFWRKALEQVKFDRTTEATNFDEVGSKGGGKISGTFGWKWLAGLTGELSGEVSTSITDAETRQRILADPSPEHLIPILQNLPYLFVVEDFHYLSETVQKNLFQQWKVFVDNEVSVLVVGTTHHASDIANSNRDLVGRVSQINLTTWEIRDLRKIVARGLRHMNVTVPDLVSYEIAKESVGLPLITQSVCQRMLLNNNIREPQGSTTRLTLSRQDVYDTLHQVAQERYSDGFASKYDRLTRGPRKNARKYDTYEVILSTFTLDPIVFSLTKEEIFERIRKLPLAPADLPPTGSVMSTLQALRGFQKQLSATLLEWSAGDQCLYILEPTFLFWLRWRMARNTSPSVEDLLLEFRTYQSEVEESY